MSIADPGPTQYERAVGVVQQQLGLLIDQMVHAEARQEDVTSWDSFTHLSLLLALEGRYGIVFPPDAHATLTSVPAIAAAVVAAGRRWIALDLDGTVWAGVLAEDGADGVLLDLRLQDVTKELVRRGLVVTLVSKNDPTDVHAALQTGAMGRDLTESIATWRAGWQPKAAMLADLSAELGLSLEHCLLVDDNPVERLVAERLLPQIGALPPHLLNPALFPLAETQEDRERATMYRTERLRRALAHDKPDTWLRELGMEARIRSMTEREEGRCVQLLAKANQLNLSLQRLSPEALRRMTVHWLHLHDRYGDYGIVGVVAARSIPADRSSVETWVIEELAVSCRALGRGVEDALLWHSVRAAEEGGASRIRAVYRDGPRNKPMRQFLPRHGFIRDLPRDPLDRVGYTLPLPAPHVRWPAWLRHRRPGDGDDAPAV